MLTKYPSSIRSNVFKKDEKNVTNTLTTTQRSEKEAITSERVRTVAKLEGRGPNNINKVDSHVLCEDKKESSVSKENRSSKESGKGSSVCSSLDDKDDFELCVSGSPDASRISPRVSQLLDDLDDTMIKITNDKDKFLGIISEEDEIKSHSNSNYNLGYIINDSEKFHKNKIRKSDTDSNSFTSSIVETESNTQFNDTESSTSNEPDSPLTIPNCKEFEKGKNSFRRKNSGRSILSVLSSSSIRSSTYSLKNFSRGSLSDPEEEFRSSSPGSLSKADRVLGRTGIGSLSLRKRRSKSTISMLNPESRSISPLSPEYDRPGSPDDGEKPSKVGKILGLTASEEKILLEKPPTGKIKKNRGLSASHADEKYLYRNKERNGGLGSNNSFGVDRTSKVGKILGWDEDNHVKRTPSMYMDKVGFGSRSTVDSSVTVASIRNNLIYTSYLAKHQSSNFLSKAWKKRYFVLAKNTLYCFKSHESGSSLIESFEITATTVVCVSEAFTGKPWVLEVSKGAKPWFLQSDTLDEMKKWMKELKGTVAKCKYNSQESTEVSSTSPELFIMDPPDNINEDDKFSLSPPPRPSMMTSLPPPPRTKSSPTDSGPPSPTLIPIPEVEKHSGPIKMKLQRRPSSPVETLSPPRTRYGQNMSMIIDGESNYVSKRDETQKLSHSKERMNSINSGLSIYTDVQSYKSQPSPANSYRNSPTKRTSDKRISNRQSIPILMPSSVIALQKTMPLPTTTISKNQKPLRLSVIPDPRISRLSPPPNPPNIPLPPVPPPRPPMIIPRRQNIRPPIPPIPPPRIRRPSNDGYNNEGSNVSTMTQVKIMNIQNVPSQIPSSYARSTIRSKTQNMVYPKHTSFQTLPFVAVPLTPPTKNAIEFPDDDDLDPDYADELEASRRRSQKTEGSVSSSDTTFFSITSDISNDLEDEIPQLSASGLTFVMVEETLGDGELILDIQCVKNTKEKMNDNEKKSISTESKVNGDYIPNVVNSNIS
ncbi:11795_t:CDS:2 [Diversispora eburnea]|uniref:11795_t:CDS:1 n=1 Tax=Diversispora eburnea TaxID=1213867 RepID=A0A9N8VCV9_9GLOM|nr:11795_t:CDS:2 [Diversispora eburnea]